MSGLAEAATFTDETLAVDGRPRRFLVHDYSGAAPAPLVILLHGGGGSGENMVQQTGFDTVAEREGLVAVYPYGSSALFDNILLTWNAGHCCAYAMRENVDDVRFISLLIDHLVATGAADPERVYVTGLSNGGMMTHRLGRELPHKIAAIAPVISSLFGDEPVRPSVLPTLIINGADDRIVPVEGGELGVSLLLGAINGNNTADRAALPVASQAEYWAAVNGCTAFTDTGTALWERRSYASCSGTGAVHSYLVRNNGHAWPGGTAPRAEADQPVQSVSANDLLWNFFRQQRRTSGNAPVLLPYYYDEQLTIPAFLANGRAYSAVLTLLPGSPPLFELKTLLAPDAEAAAGANVYQQGLLTLPRVSVGSQHYRATLNVLGTNPTRLSLRDLTRLE
jgi:polyhydroxybutyrate depolymerase